MVQGGKGLLQHHNSFCGFPSTDRNQLKRLKLYSTASQLLSDSKGFFVLSAQTVMNESDVYVSSTVNFGEFPRGVIGRQSINQCDVENYKEKKHPLYSVL